MVDIRFFPSAEMAYNFFESSKRSQILFSSINQKISYLKHEPHYGNPIAKRLIPAKYAALGITNLFRIELPHYFRLLYTITKDNENNMLIFITDILNHKKYNRLFGY